MKREDVAQRGASREALILANNNRHGRRQRTRCEKIAKSFVQSGEIRFHIVDGSDGPTVVLIAGFSQTA
jgi:hypothetical protein